MVEIFFSVWSLGSFAVAVFLFWCWYRFCLKEIQAVNGEIEKFLAWLNPDREFQDIDAEFKNHNRLLPVWKNFEKTLTKTGDAAYSTTEAADFFSPQNLTRGMNMPFWQAYGGIFTGLGILFTFWGLTNGLSGVDMTGGDIETLKAGIAKLLSGVETAFVTSLFGISSAIGYSILHHWLLKKFQKNLKTLTEKLDESFPRRSAEDWLAQNCKIADDQTNSIKEIGEAVTQAIYEGLDEKLGEAVDRLDPLVEKICDAIENLGADGTDTIGKIISANAGTQMDRFSAALDRFSDSIDEKLKTAGEVSETMNAQLLTTLEKLSAALTQQAATDKANRDADYKKFSETLGGLINTLNVVTKKFQAQQENSATNFETTVTSLLGRLENFSRQQEALLNKTSSSNVMQISAAVASFKEIVDRHNQTTQKTFNQIQTLLNETEKFLQQVNSAGISLKQAAEPVKQSTLQLTKNLEATSAQMKTLAVANQTTRQNLFDLTARLADFVKNFNGLADELERSTEIITNSLDNYNYEISAGLTDALTKFDSTVGNASTYLKEIMEELGGELEDFKKNRR